MTTTFGVSMDESLAGRIEEHLEYGDSRSERCRDLIELGLEVEDAMKDAGIYTPDHTAQLTVVRDAISEHARSEDE